MNNIMTIIKKELARFFGDRRLVFTTVIMPGLLIYLMYTLMGEGMMKQLSTADDYVAKAYVVNMPEDVKMMVSGLRIEWEDWDGNPADKEKILKEIEEGEKDLLVYFPENFTADVEAYNMENKAPNIEMYFNSEKSNSETAYRMMQSFLTAYEETMVNKYDVNAGPGEGTYGKYDMASEAGILGKMLSGLLPMLIMTFIFSGCSGVAPESIAGEKERGTIATLLVTPVKRSALALGKIISLSVIALLAGVSSFLGTILSLPKMVGNEVDINVVSYSITDYLLLFVVIISTVLVMVSIISIVSASAKSVKEATTMMAPFMIGVMLISILPMLGADIGGKAAYAIPLFNSVKAMSAIFGFETDVVMSLVAVGVNLVATGVLVMVLTKMFDNENVMFGK
ncbi:MAG: ABC transporter permease [Lachnospiraceae bacterium]|jgi:sodium transport system permease protein|nr:ABC transporter permease [Lachnospiraceae bacterium]